MVRRGLAERIRERGLLRSAVAACRRVGWTVATGIRRRWFSAAERRFDRRHGLDTAGLDHPQDYQESVAGAVHYQGVRPSIFARMLAASGVDPSEFAFVDLGAGKGRALALAVQAGFRRVIGVELSPSLVDAARRNLSDRGQVELHVGDATRFRLPDEPTMLFLFNPFRGDLMRTFLDHLEAQMAGREAPLILAYVNPAEHPMIRERGLGGMCAEGHKFKIYDLVSSGEATATSPR